MYNGAVQLESFQHVRLAMFLPAGSWHLSIAANSAG